MSIVFSCIIPASAKDAESQNLKDLIASIKAQDFPQDQIEILVITEGDSESAKGIGIKRAKGEICAMFCADNFITDQEIFKSVDIQMRCQPNLTGFYGKFYRAVKQDNSLNKYFSLIGNNDPIAFYLNKCDRRPFYEHNPNEIRTTMMFQNSVPSLGDNGFFFRRSHLIQAGIDNYYPMDIAEDLRKKGLFFYERVNLSYLWHRTSDNLISFLKKRYKYARTLYSDRADRRWRIIDGTQDLWKLAGFVLCTIGVVPCLYTSFKGFSKIRDLAWFWHWPVCFGFLVTYSILAFRNLFKYGRLFQCPQPLPS